MVLRRRRPLGGARDAQQPPGGGAEEDDGVDYHDPLSDDETTERLAPGTAAGVRGRDKEGDDGDRSESGGRVEESPRADVDGTLVVSKTGDDGASSGDEDAAVTPRGGGGAAIAAADKQQRLEAIFAERDALERERDALVQKLEEALARERLALQRRENRTHIKWGTLARGPGGCALIVAAISAAYSPILEAGYAWDDMHVLEQQNSRLLGRSLSDLRDIWKRPHSIAGTTATGVRYRPVLHSTFWAEARMFGGGGDGKEAHTTIGVPPRIRHAFTLILHCFNACLVCRLLRRVGACAFAALLAALLFALHPVNVEAVAWIVGGRRHVLATFFGLGSLLVHPSTTASVAVAVADKSRERARGGDDNEAAGAPARGDGDDLPRVRKQLACAVSLVLYTLGLLSDLDSVVLLLPAALLLIPWALRGRTTLREVEDSLPFVAAGVTVSICEAARLVAAVNGEQKVDFGLSPARRALLAFRGIAFYLHKIAWPVGLAMIYPRWGLTREHERAVCLACLVASCGALVALVALRDRLSRWPVTAAALFVAALGPVALGLVDGTFMQCSFVADRYQYLAGAFPVCLLSVAVVGAINRRGRGCRYILMAALGILLLTLGSLTWRQTHHYLDEEHFFTHIVETDPHNMYGWWYLGTNVYFPRNDFGRAVQCYEKAAEIFDRNGTDPVIKATWGSKVRVNYGIALNRLERYEESVDQLNEALLVNPNSTRVLNEAGNAMSSLDRHEEAAEFRALALDLNPGYAIGWFNLGNDLQRAGKADEAVEPYEKAIALNPSYWKARLNLAVALGTLELHEEAMKQLQEVLSLQPGNRFAVDLMDKALARIGQRAPSENLRSSNKDGPSVPK